MEIPIVVALIIGILVSVYKLGGPARQQSPPPSSFLVAPRFANYLAHRFGGGEDLAKVACWYKRLHEVGSSGWTLGVMTDLRMDEAELARQICDAAIQFIKQDYDDLQHVQVFGVDGAVYSVTYMEGIGLGYLHPPAEKDASFGLSSVPPAASAESHARDKPEREHPLSATMVVR